MTKLTFNQEISNIESLLIGFAMRLTRNKENAKDLMQETLMRCYDKRDRFHEGTNFKSWVTTVMYNSFINHYRKSKTKNKVIKQVEDFSYIAENRSTQGNPESVIFMKELESVVNSLTDTYKIPFTMFAEGFHYDEIAAALDLPMGTVKSRIFYARKKLSEKVRTLYGPSATMVA